MKPFIHFAHANGIPSKTYQKLFDQLQSDYDIAYVTALGTDQRYPVTSGWANLRQQVIDNIVQHAQGRKAIGLGHSLGSILTLMAAYQRPELFERVILLDPPLVLGKNMWRLQFAKLFQPQKIDQMSPAGLSARRRDHWESKQQAAESLRSKGFYKDFDAECFQAYIDHGLVAAAQGGVTLTIPKQAEVSIFRTKPAFWWKPVPKPPVPVTVIAGKESRFSQQQFPQMMHKNLDIPFMMVKGGHMFPLQYPSETVQNILNILNDRSEDQ